LYIADVLGVFENKYHITPLSIECCKYTSSV